MLLNAFLDYLLLEKNYSQHTVLAYQRDIEEFDAFCGNMEEELLLDMVEYDHVRSWVVYLVEQDRSPKSINRKMSSLGAYYKFLCKIGERKSNPLGQYKALKVPKKVVEPFAVSEMQQLFDSIEVADDFESIRNRLILELLYATGMRRAELIGLKCVDVDLGGKTIKVLGKRNKERLLPLMEVSLYWLKKYLCCRDLVVNEDSEDYLLLLKSGKKIYGTLVYRVINAYFSKVSSKVKKSPHVLRHTFATHLLNQGADLNSVKELLGHASLASTQVYTHNNMATLKKTYLNFHPRNKK